jgi:hypothetical protein
MQDVYDVIRNIERIYDSNTDFQVLKDFERVLDEIDTYVYKNWFDGELASGPHIDRHWVTVRLFWPREKMPDPMGGKRLLDYDCHVKYYKTHLIKPRKIQEPSDMRPGTKKGKLDREPIWIVEIQMPKSLIADIYTGYQEQKDEITEPTYAEPDTLETAPPEEEAADMEGAGEETGLPDEGAL